jgi:Leucine-rich repeat (LRR) protein
MNYNKRKSSLEIVKTGSLSKIKNKFSLALRAHNKLSGDFEDLILWADRLGISEKDIPRSAIKLHALDRLDLSSSGIEVIPNDIFQLTELVELKLTRDLISELPNDIRKLKKLKILDLSGNSELSAIPNSIVELQELEYLNLNSCNISTFPNDISQMRSLRKLELSYNPLDLNEIIIGNNIHLINTGAI